MSLLPGRKGKAGAAGFFFVMTGDCIILFTKKTYSYVTIREISSFSSFSDHHPVVVAGVCAGEHRPADGRGEIRSAAEL
jgi:hypothetical protein